MTNTRKQKNNILRTLVDTIVVLFFWVSLIVGLVGATYLTVDRTFENRKLAPWPTLSADNVLSLKFLPDLTSALRDRHLFREHAIISRNWIKYRLFGVQPAKNVTFGDDDWLFLVGPARTACRETRSSQDMMRSVETYLNSLQKPKSKFFVMFPNKDYMYLDKIREPVAAGLHKCSTDRFMRDMNAGENILGTDFIDLRGKINSRLAQSQTPLYFKQDTHWTFDTSVWISGQIIDAIEPGLWNKADVHVKNKKKGIQDISRIVGLPRDMEWLVQASDRQGIKLAHQDFSVRYSRRQPVRTFHYQSASADKRLIKGNTILVYDSFLIPTFRVLSPYFENITWVFWDDFSRPEVQTLLHNADRVILASIYRLAFKRISQMAKLAKHASGSETAPQNPTP